MLQLASMAAPVTAHFLQVLVSCCPGWPLITAGLIADEQGALVVLVEYTATLVILLAHCHTLNLAFGVHFFQSKICLFTFARTDITVEVSLQKCGPAYLRQNGQYKDKKHD